MLSFLAHLRWCAVFALAGPAFAQAPLTLDGALMHARERSPALAGAAAGLRAADAGTREARAMPNPVLSYEVENVAGSGPYAGTALRESTTTLQLPIELGGKRAARGAVADAERAGAAVAVEIAAAELTLHVTEAFIAVAANTRRAEVAQARLGFAEQALRAAELRVRHGKASPIDVQRAQVQQVAAQVQADQAERARTLAADQLARLTGLPASTLLAADWFDAADRPADDAAVSDVRTALALAAQDAQVSVAQTRLTAARRARVPDVTLVAGSRRFAETRDTATVIGVSLPIPLFNRGTASVARAQAELDRSEAERAAALLAVEHALADARTEVRNAQALAAAASGPALAAAAEAARIARIGYAAGKFSQLDLLDAERAWTDTRRDAIDALAAYHIAHARLARLLGHADTSTRTTP